MNAQQLKNAILQEAIEGRLVPQDPNDEPASALLARIRKEKEELVKAGKLKKKDLEVKPISEDEIPFEIPESWEWCRVGDISESYIGLTYKPSDVSEKGWIVLRSSNIQDGKIDYNDIVRVNVDVPTKLHVRENDIIICARNGSKKLVGKSAIVKNVIGPMTFGAFMAICRTDFFLYMSKYLLSPLFFEQLRKDSGTTTINQLTQKNFNGYLVPLPPLAEQHRIVAKIEELLPKVEEYGKAQDALNKLNAELPERLKKSILQEAISGRLVPQDPNDEPASVLLAKIRKEKEELVKAGKLKKKDLIETPISEDEIPFEIPESWEWVRLGDIGIFERGNGIKRDETFKSGYPCVRYGEMYTKYKYAPTFEETVSFTSKVVFEKCRKAHKGDLFMALTGENKQDISLAAQYVGDEEIAVGGDLCHFTILEAYGLYFVYLINSAYFSSKKEILATGDIIVHISTDKLSSIPIPLPPLAEQHRIVEKLEQLLSEVDKLKK